MTEGAAAAAAGMELNDFLALDPQTREFLRKTLNEDAKALMAELGNDPKAKGSVKSKETISSLEALFMLVNWSLYKENYAI